MPMLNPCGAVIRKVDVGHSAVDFGVRMPMLNPCGGLGNPLGDVSMSYVFRKAMLSHNRSSWEMAMQHGTCLG